MKRLQVILVLLLWQVSANGQFDFPNDTSFHLYRETVITKIDSIFHLSKDNDFELRLWSNYVKMSGWSLFILTHKSNKWTARLFEGKRTSNFTLKETEVSNSGLEKLWSKLLSEKIFTLKTSDDLVDSSGNEASVSFTDGASYKFELLARKSKRSFFYYCPKANAEEYNYIKEFKQVLNIIRLIYKHCNLPENYITKKQAASNIGIANSVAGHCINQQR